MAALLFASFSWSVNLATDPIQGISTEDLNLVGDVREVFSEEAAVSTRDSELREGPRYPVERIVFDADGFVTEWIEYDRSGDVDETRRYAYADGHLIQQETYGRWRWPTETITYTHEASGVRTTAEVSGSDGSLKKTVVYERGADGKLATVTEHDEDGAEVSRVIYTYSADSKRADRYGPDGELASWSIETHDSGGRLLKLELHTEGSDDDPFVISYELDSHGNVTLEETTGTPTLPFIVITATPSETKIQYEYTYDDDGNWTKRIESVWVSTGESPGWRATAATYRTIRHAGS
jgi:hypothetical protein